MGCDFSAQRGLVKMGGEMKRTSRAHSITGGGGLSHGHGAFNPDMAVHQGYQLLGDRQTQTGAAIFTGGATICLGKSPENRFLFFPGYPDPGISDRKNQMIRILSIDFRTNHQDNLTFIRKFNGVADEI